MNRDPDILQLLEAVRRLEERVAKIEAVLNLWPGTASQEGGSSGSALTGPDQHEFEQQVGQYWLANLGFIILVLGVGFLLTLPYRGVPPALPSLMGYAIAGLFVAFGQRRRGVLRYARSSLLAGGIVLVYFATLRLHFFTDQPAIQDRTLLTVLLALTTAGALLLSARVGSRQLAGLSLFLGCVTGLVSGTAAGVMAASLTISAIAVFFALRREWARLLPLAAVLNVTGHALWFLGTPLATLPAAQIPVSVLHAWILLLCIVVIAAGALRQSGKQSETALSILTAVANGAGGYGLFLAMTALRYRDALIVSHLAASLLLLGIAAMFWLRQRSTYATFVYVMLAYAALSMAIMSGFPAPGFFFWLSWQSIIVITTALWFRSRVIVTANFFIQLLLLGVSLGVAAAETTLFFSFGAVALLSASLLDLWRERLHLQSAFLRNAYLACAFFAFPYALYLALPPHFVSLSWVGAALTYYLLARLTRSSAYRWMALMTLGLTIGRVLLLDITGVEPGFRVVLFIVLGLVLLAISLAYARRRGRSAPPSIPIVQATASPDPSATAMSHPAQPAAPEKGAVHSN